MSSIPAVPLGSPARTRAASPARDRDGDAGFELALGVASAPRADIPRVGTREPEPAEGSERGGPRDADERRSQVAPSTTDRDAMRNHEPNVPGTPGTVTRARGGAQNVPVAPIVARPGLPAEASPAPPRKVHADLELDDARTSPSALAPVEGLDVRVLGSRSAPRATPAAPADGFPAQDHYDSDAATAHADPSPAANELRAIARARPRAAAALGATPSVRIDGAAVRATAPGQASGANAGASPDGREGPDSHGGEGSARGRGKQAVPFAEAVPAPAAGLATARTAGAATGPRLTAPAATAAAIEDPRLEPLRRVADQVTLRFEGENGLEGRLRIAVRGDAVHASILSSDEGTLQRLGGEVTSLRRALSEQGFAEAKVVVHDTRATGAAETHSDARGGEERRQGEPQRRSGHGREFRHDSGPGRDRRAPRDERRSE